MRVWMDKKIVIVESLRLFKLSHPVPLRAEIESSREEPLGTREVVLEATSPRQEVSILVSSNFTSSRITHQYYHKGFP